MFRKLKKADALQGTLDLLILKTLHRGPMHGYGIVNHLGAVSGESLRVDEGSLYPALHRMEQAGWIAAEWTTTQNNRRARIYRLTKAGHARLEEETEKWARLTAGVRKVLRYS